MKCLDCGLEMRKECFYERGYKYHFVCGNPQCREEYIWFDSHDKITQPHLTYLLRQEEERKKVKRI